MSTAESSTVELNLEVVVIPVADLEAPAAADRYVAEVKQLVPSA